MRRLALSRSAALNFPAKFGPNATRGLESATHGIHLQPTPPESSPPRTRRQPDTSVFFPACRCRIQSPTPPRAQLEITPHRTQWTPPIHPPLATWQSPIGCSPPMRLQLHRICHRGPIYISSWSTFVIPTTGFPGYHRLVCLFLLKMSPSHFHEDSQKESVPKSGDHLSPQPLRISKDSHSPMKRPSSSSSSSTSSSPQSSLSSATSSSSGSPLVNGGGPRGGPPRGGNGAPHHRQPVIIYTHSPKVIHTQPQDFMALVQKLTGLCRTEEDRDGQPPPPSQRPKREPSSLDDPEDNKNQFKITISDETDSSSVITDENISVNSIGDSQVIDSSLPPPLIFDGPPPNPYMPSFPVFNPSSSADFLRPNQSNFYSNYGDRLFFSPSVRSTFSSSPSLEMMMMMNEFRECWSQGLILLDFAEVMKIIIIITQKRQWN